MIIYPAIDIKGGRCVRLEQGKADRETVYYEDPADPAELWKQAGAEWIHVVDLDGAFGGKPSNLDAVKRILDAGMKVQLGGGMRSEETVAAALEAGVQRVVIGTRACQEPEFAEALAKQFGGERIAVGIDAKDGKVAVKGWVDTTDVTALDLAKTVSDAGVGTIIYTDISRDGMLIGPNFEAQETLLKHVTANIIASGGVSEDEDIRRFQTMSEEYGNLDGVITGKALYEGRIHLKELLEA